MLNDQENSRLETDLSKFRVVDYHAGPKWKIALWYLFNYFIFDSALPLPYIFKQKILVFFGASIGKNLVIKPKVRIKYPWRLVIGDNCWIGESVWIDNLAHIQIGNNVCLSQGSMLLTGNHDYTLYDFPYRLGNIRIENGVWIGAKAVVCPGIHCKSHSILTVNSVASSNLEAYMIYGGNPAIFVRTRRMKAV